jgi:hypothetical protein
MRAVVLSITGVGDSGVYPVDTYISPSNMGLAVVVSGTITYKAQYTFDDVFAKGYSPTAGTSTWFDHPTLTGSASLNSNIAYPVTGIRLTTSAGTGTATLTIIQAGGGGNA